MPPSCVSAAERVVAANEALVALDDGEDDTEEKQAVIDAVETLDGRLRNAAVTQASRMPGGPASPARLCGVAGAPTNDNVLRLILYAVRTLAEVNAAAVSTLLACW